MTLDPTELAMKAATMTGVIVAAAGIVMLRVSPRARARCFAIAAAGVGLMFANALVAASPFAMLVDLAYLAFAAATFIGGIRDGRAPAHAPVRTPAPAAAKVIATRAILVTGAPAIPVGPKPMPRAAVRPPPGRTP